MILVLRRDRRAGGVVEVSRETLTFARDLAAAGGGVPIDAVVVGDVPDGLRRRSSAAYGVRTVHHADGDALRVLRRRRLGRGRAWPRARRPARSS